MITLVSTGAWVLYVLSSNVGWTPMVQTEFTSKSACEQVLAKRKTSLENLGGRVELRCRPPGWDGKDADAQEL